MVYCLRLILLTTILALCGCAKTFWVKPGATQQDFARDSYECERDARQSGYFGTGIAGAINMQAFQERCMVARGWSKQTEQRQAERPVNEQDQVLLYCVQREPWKPLADCRRDEAARRGLRSP